MVLDVLGLQLHEIVVEDEESSLRTRRRTQPIGNIVSQSDSVTATAATTATAAACISSLADLHLYAN